MLPAKSKSISTADFTATNLDEMLDLLAIAAYEHAVTADGQRVKWTIDGPGRSTDLDPAKIPANPHAGWNMERFEIQRI